MSPIYGTFTYPNSMVPLLEGPDGRVVKRDDDKDDVRAALVNIRSCAC